MHAALARGPGIHRRGVCVSPFTVVPFTHTEGGYIHPRIMSLTTCCLPLRAPRVLLPACLLAMVRRLRSIAFKRHAGQVTGRRGQQQQRSGSHASDDQKYQSPGNPVPHLLVPLQAYLRPEHALLTEVGDSWFNTQKLHLPDGCR